MIRRKFSMASALVAYAALGGCIGLPDGGAVSGRYNLNPPEMTRAATPVAVQVIIDAPRASRALDTALIAVAATPHRYAYYPDAEWADSAPELVQTVLLRTFEDSGALQAAARRTDGVRGEARMISELRRFEAAPGDNVVRIEFYAKLISTPGGRLIAERAFVADEPAQTSRVDGVVPAFDAAMQRLAPQIVAWTADALSDD